MVLSDDDGEKLSQEAFRLYRTAQNLLNLKEPFLSESKTVPFHRNSMSDLKMNSCPMQTYGITSLQRKLNLRESHNSYQSSSTSDGSLNSNSSSVRTETDEENSLYNQTNHDMSTLHPNQAQRSNTVPSNQTKYSPANEISILNLRKSRIKSIASSADDESGFSSMNSFQYEMNGTSILPHLTLNTTLLSDQHLLDDNNGNKNEHFYQKPENNNVILENNIMKTETKPNLLSLKNSCDVAPPIPPKKNLTSFNSLKNDDSPGKTSSISVLWV